MDKIISIKSISQLHQMLGTSGNRHPLVTIVDYKDVMMEASYVNTRFVTDFYIVSMKSPAPKSLLYGRQYYDFDEGTLFFIAPRQVFQVGEIDLTVPQEGWSLFFHPDLIAGSPIGRNIKNYSFFAYHANEALHVSDEEKNTLSSIINSIRSEYTNNIDDFSRTVIVTAIEQLFNYSMRFYSRQFITRHKQNTDTLARFEQLLSDYFNSGKASKNGIPGVEYFASELNYSANYLSDLLRKETGKSTKDHIQEEVMTRAKELLLNSKMTINEIAYELGFEYPQYFNRLFKNLVGQTPSIFRKHLN